jgi:hypothetical protein
MRGTDNGTGNDTIRFGWEYGATPGLDLWLCETEPPPPPPSGVFDVRFLSPGGNRYADYRPYHPGGIDTFLVMMQAGEGGYPISFSWDSTLVAFAYDSCLIQDEFGGFLTRAWMQNTASIRLTNPALASLVILAWQRRPEGTPPPTRIRLRVSDAGEGVDNLWVGYDPTARPGIDLHLSEFEVPVMPPSGVFFAVLKNPPGHDGADTSTGLGMGSFSDYRTQRGEAAVDTHLVSFQPGEGGYPMHIRWSTDSVHSLCDSAVIIDEFGGTFYRKRMDLDSILSVTNPSLNRLLIIRYGQNPLVAVGEREDHPYPDSRLEWNYPNPFNGETRIGYRIQPVRTTEPGGGPGDGGRVVLNVYDLLGRIVRVLVNEHLPPGEHIATFDANGLPSGVYVVVLRAGGKMTMMKMILAR